MPGNHPEAAQAPVPFPASSGHVAPLPPPADTRMPLLIPFPVCFPIMLRRSLIQRLLDHVLVVDTSVIRD